MARRFILASILLTAIASAVHAQVGDQANPMDPAAQAAVPGGAAASQPTQQRAGATSFLSNPANPTCSIALGCDPLDVPTANL